MANQTFFRAMVCAYLLLYVVYYFVPATMFQNEDGAINLLKLDGYSALYNFGNYFETVLFFLWIVASLGLVHFDSWARTLFLGMTTWSILAPVFYGIRVTAPLEIMLGGLITTLGGAILAIAYLSPVRDRFSRQQV